MIQIISRNNIIHIDIDNTLISSLRKLLYLLEEFKAENEQTVPPLLVNLLLNVMDTFDIGSMTNETSKEVKNLNDYLIKQNETMKTEMVEFLRKNKGKEITRNKMNEVTNFINTLSVWSTDQSKTIRNKHHLTNDSIYNFTHFFKSFVENFVGIFPNIILNMVDYKENYIPKYLGLSKIHEKKVKTIISDYYDNLRGFYDVPALNNILQKLPRSCENLLKLSKNTPTFITIKNKINGKDEEIKPIFDERTSKFLYEYYLLKVLSEYIDLTDEPAMIVKNVQRRNIVGNRVDLEDVVTVDYLDETNTAIDVNVDIDDRIEFDTNLLSGDKKELKQKVANLLIEFLRIMNSYKEIVDVSYDQVLDRIFKLKEKEKDIMTDRLKKLTDEERDADTILKVNKLGVWSKGLQKGLTNYVKETYDEEREFVEQMLQYERKAQKKIRETNMDNTNLDIVLDELIEETERENEIEREAYDIGGYTEDYLDGQFEGDDVDYDDYYDS